jgi:hypothetical protein
VPVAYTCHPSYIGGKLRRMPVLGQPEQTVSKTLSQQKNLGIVAHVLL